MQQLVLVLGAILVVVAALAAMTVSLVLAAAGIRRRRIRLAARPTGRLVDAARTRVHVIRRGPDRGPTVVLVAGAGGVGASWAGIQQRLAGRVASLAYDRPGLGWSGPTGGPRTLARLVDELESVLAASGAPGPYVLVGHSLGGVVARRYAASHVGDVAGLVLVDSAHEEQYARIPEVERLFRRVAAMPGPIVRLMGALAVLRGGTPADDRLPAADAAAVRAATLVGGSHLSTTMAESRAVVAGDEPVGDLGDLPLAVLRHGRHERMPMLSPELNDRFEALFAELQGELARLSTRGRLVVADGAGHDIHLDRPDLVVAAIEEVLAEAATAAAGAPAAATDAGEIEEVVTPPGAPVPLAQGELVASAVDRVPAALATSGPRRRRLAATLAAFARPLLVTTGALVATGAILAAAGVPAGWLAYLGGYASAALALPALAAAHGERLGRVGRAAFGLATVGVVLGTPVVAMVAAFVLQLDALHVALMPYATSLPGMLGAFGVIVAVALVGVVVARAGVVPAVAGWLLVAGALLDVPVELGLLPLTAWAIGMTLIGAAFALAARAIPGAAGRSRLDARPEVALG